MGFSYGNGDETLDWTDYLRSRIDLGRSMLDRVEKIQIVDSINVPADQFSNLSNLPRAPADWLMNLKSRVLSRKSILILNQSQAYGLLHIFRNPERI